jgi:hypothetical protein
LARPTRRRRPLDAAADATEYRVVIVEHPDPGEARWATALDLLLEAGRQVPAVEA